MKKSMKLMAAVALLSSTGALADDIQLGQPAYGGSGCPAGTASAALSPDNQALSILFDSYQVEAGGVTGRTVDRKSCNIAIPVHVPQGYSVAVFQVDYRGFNAIPAGGRTQFNVEYFFAGYAGPRATRLFQGPQTQDFLVSNQLVAETLVWSPCGADTILRTNSSMMAVTNGRREQTFASIDSADIQAGIVYQLQWRRCGI
jgi:hypothetical protein